MKNTFEKISTNFRDFFQKTGTKKAILGLSGGIDSALTLKIAINALSKEKLHVLLMPHKDFSSQENLQDARDLAKSSQVEFEEIEISPFCKEFCNLKYAENELASANMMSRIRMVLLYMAANSMNGIVLGTSNKTEIMTGFFTKYGDGGIDVEVIGTLWKSEVFAMGKEVGLPENFLTKKPSAELFDQHFDEVEIGVEYPEIDRILKEIEKNEDFSPQSEAEKIIFKLWKNSDHKRSMPFIIPRG